MVEAGIIVLMFLVAYNLLVPYQFVSKNLTIFVFQIFLTQTDQHKGTKSGASNVKLVQEVHH